jgi:hypothetical protein
MLNKEEIILRVLKHHAVNGRVHKAILTVLNTNYPEGTNLVLKFAEMFIGLPYKHTNMNMDSGVDCEEFWRIIFYIWFGIDIGSFSDAAYYSKLGKLITTNYKDWTTCRDLDLGFYHTSSTKKTGHVVGKDGMKLLQSGASVLGERVGFTGFLWHNSIFMCVKRYLTDSQYKSILAPKPPQFQLKRILEKGSRGDDVRELQKILKIHEDGVFGSQTLRYVRKFQDLHKLKVDGQVGEHTAKALGWSWIGGK